MSFFNEMMNRALETGEYICSECGGLMEMVDHDTLWCPKCGHEIDYDHYGFESDEEYEAQFPSLEEVLGYENDEDEEDED